MVNGDGVKSEENIKKISDKRMPEFYKYLRLDSVSTQDRKILETAEYVKQLIEQTGGQAKLLNDLGGNPIVYGYFEAGPKADSDKTLLFYNHYDVQPEDPIEEWESEPFEPTVREGILYCRGVADNKANFMARLYAIEALKNSEEGLPCAIKFFVEGEEENGSPSIDLYLEKYAELFQADACIWESGGKDSGERFIIDAGIKGIAYFDVSVESAAVDIHSSIGAIADNAAWRLVQALGSMRNSRNEILVEGFYDTVIPPSALEKTFVKKLPFDETATKADYGLKNDLITKDKNITPNEALTFLPTLTISGFLSGYTQAGSKTVLPRSASAKIDCRIVPGQEPQYIRDILRRHLDRYGFQDVELELIKAEMPFRTDLSDPFVQTVIKSAEKVYGKQDSVFVSPSAAGTGPMHGFGKFLNVPIVGSGTGWSRSGAHAPNESVRLKDFYQGIEHMIVLIEDFGQRDY